MASLVSCLQKLDSGWMMSGECQECHGRNAGENPRYFTIYWEIIFFIQNIKNSCHNINSSHFVMRARVDCWTSGGGFWTI